MCNKKKGNKAYSKKGWRKSECKECCGKLVKEIETHKITLSPHLPSLSLDTWEIIISKMIPMALIMRLVCKEWNTIVMNMTTLWKATKPPLYRQIIGPHNVYNLVKWCVDNYYWNDDIFGMIINSLDVHNLVVWCIENNYKNRRNYLDAANYEDIITSIDEYEKFSMEFIADILKSSWHICLERWGYQSIRWFLEYYETSEEIFILCEHIIDSESNVDLVDFYIMNLIEHNSDKPGMSVCLEKCFSLASTLMESDYVRHNDKDYRIFVRKLQELIERKSHGMVAKRIEFPDYSMLKDISIDLPYFDYLSCERDRKRR